MAMPPLSDSSIAVKADPKITMTITAPTKPTVTERVASPEGRGCTSGAELTAGFFAGAATVDTVLPAIGGLERIRTVRAGSARRKEGRHGRAGSGTTVHLQPSTADGQPVSQPQQT